VDEFTPILEAVADKSIVNVVVGQFIRTEQSGSIVVVATAPGQMPVKCRPMSDYRPEPLELVRVLFIDGVAFYAGAATSKPGKGVVATVSGGLAAVVTDIGTVSCSYSTAPSSGNSVKLAWNEGPHIMGVVGAYPIQSVAPSDPVYVPKPHTFIFKANMSGQVIYPSVGGQPGVWYPGGFTAVPGMVTRGYWFYGPQIASTIPAGATINTVEVYLPPFVGGWGVVAVHTAKNPAEAAALYPPDSDPSWFLAGTYGVSASGTGQWFGAPPAFGAAIAAGEVSVQPRLASGGGSDVPHLQGLDLLGDGTGDNMSGAIRITATY